MIWRSSFQLHHVCLRVSWVLLGLHVLLGLLSTSNDRNNEGTSLIGWVAAIVSKTKLATTPSLVD